MMHKHSNRMHRDGRGINVNQNRKYLRQTNVHAYAAFSTRPLRKTCMSGTRRWRITVELRGRGGILSSEQL